MDTLKDLRRRRGWSQKDLAEESGVGQDTISGIESGRHEPRPSTLRKLADALDVEVADFFREPALPKAEAPREAGRAEWEAAVRNARQLRDAGHTRMGTLLSSWRSRRDRQYLDQIGELLQESYDAVSALLSNLRAGLATGAAAASERPGEWVPNPGWEEVREAERFYLALLEMVYGAGLHVRREHEAHEVKDAA